MSTATSATQTAQEVLSNLARKDATTSTATEDNRIQFLTLLTTQLQNQDPMSPMENAELTSQLAQMSTVEGIEKLNTMMTQLLASQESSEGLQASTLIGRGVLVEGRGAAADVSGCCRRLRA